MQQQNKCHTLPTPWPQFDQVPQQLQTGSTKRAVFCVHVPPWRCTKHQCTTKQGPDMTARMTLGSQRLPERKSMILSGCEQPPQLHRSLRLSPALPGSSGTAEGQELPLGSHTECAWVCRTRTAPPRGPCSSGCRAGDRAGRNSRVRKGHKRTS